MTGSPPSNPAKGPSKSAKKSCSTSPCAGKLTPAQQRDQAHEDLIKCILELCAKDGAVVAEASKKLTVNSREPKKMALEEFKNGKWEVVRNMTSGGSARGSEIWINRGEPCAKTKNTVFHEVRHTQQPNSMSSRDKELDAYKKTEEWTIQREKEWIKGGKKGPAPPAGRFRTKDKAGNTVVDEAAIQKFVDKSYGYAPGKKRIVKTKNGGKTVVFSDGTSRKAQAGDRRQVILTSKADMHIRKIPPSRLKCP